MSSPVIVLTGASSGIGAAVAREFARRQGARIGLLARRKEQLDEVAAAVVEAGGEALVLPCDVTDAEAVQRAVDAVREAFGPIDLALANAGIGDPTPVRRFDAECVGRIMRVNFDGAVHLFAACLPEMIERRRGHLVGVSSLAAYRGLPKSGGYSASKAALSALMESMRLELPALGVAVTTVHPGFVKTPMTDKNNFPMPFILDVEDAAALVVRRLARRPRTIEFPWALATGMRLLRLLPNWLYDAVMGGKTMACTTESM